METEGESFEEIVFVTLLGFSTLNSMSLTAVVVMEEAMKEALMIVVVLYEQLFVAADYYKFLEV